MSTLSEILSRCLKIKVKLNLPVIVCVFDQAIYAKAVEIKWTYPDKFESCILMLGVFHMLMLFLGIIGKRYKDAGLDVLVQSEVIAEGSVDKALSGKMYNRSVRCHKIVYEALYRLFLKSMEDNVESIEEKVTIDKMEELLYELEDVSGEKYHQMCEHETIKRYKYC